MNSSKIYFIISGNIEIDPENSEYIFKIIVDKNIFQANQKYWLNI